MLVSTPTEAIDNLRSRVIATAAEAGLTLNASAQKENERLLRIGFVGIFSTGKSTFLNALIGRTLLPAAMGPKTAIPMQIFRAKGDEWAELISFKGQSEITSLERAISEGVIPPGISIEDTEQFNASVRFRRIDLHLHLPKLFESVVMIDTPGLNSPHVDHETIANAALRESDVVVYLLDDLIKDADRGALLVGRHYVSRFIFVQTKVDKPRPQGSWEETRSANKLAISEIVGSSIDVLSVSAKMALKSSEGSAEYTTSGMPRFREVLGAAISDRRRLLSLADAKRLLNATDELIHHAKQRQASLASGDLDMQQKLADLEERIRIGRIIGTRLDPLLAAGERDMQAFCEERLAGWREEIRASMLAYRFGSDPQEQVRTAALQRVSSILDRDVKDKVRGVIARIDDKALEILYDVFGIDLHGPLRSHPLINIDCPPIARSTWRKFWDLFSSKKSVDESEVNRVANEITQKLQEQLLRAARNGLEQGFVQYRSYVDSAIPAMISEQNLIREQGERDQPARDVAIEHGSLLTAKLIELRKEAASLMEALEKHVEFIAAEGA